MWWGLSCINFPVKLKLIVSVKRRDYMEHLPILLLVTITIWIILFQFALFRTWRQLHLWHLNEHPILLASCHDFLSILLFDSLFTPPQKKVIVQSKISLDNRIKLWYNFYIVRKILYFIVSFYLLIVDILTMQIYWQEAKYEHSCSRKES